ncbi:MAG: hypothetical protein II053_04320 [Bacteroidales bacterium]|nr:hypothetical protein [Bacteroidales bacterium]MBQ1682764.1 hypothetical protein [Bacteroidales bacterium]MBQ2228853.1 hypothetical protein [Bacteroidales bacterium]MBQ4201928.1 hypothetical protein [Bacteroidales bacterium]
MKLLILILTALLDIVPSGDATLQQLQKRDSILIADQIRYGVTIEDVKAGEKIALPDFSAASNDTLTILGGWQLDTLVNGKAVRSRNAKAAARLLRKPFALKASIVLVPFEEGHYALPDVPVIRESDTLVFKGLEMDVKTMPVDTATFEIHDIKGQILYPVTFKELLPWIGGGLLAAALIALAVWLIVRASKRKAEALKPKDPAYIVALRELDKYRSDKYWAPDKQKAFYSGITDALKFYMDERFGVDAPEMTTAELFDALKSDKDITPEMYSSLKELFERADFVKFAKHIASEQENAAALPLAVRFVTTTYQTDLEKETGGQEAADD